MEQFAKLFEEALEKEEGSINPKDEFRNYEEWDSLAVLSVIAMVKSNYDITIPRVDFESLKTIADLHQYIETRKK